jgi:hypothetical protein
MTQALPLYPLLHSKKIFFFRGNKEQNGMMVIKGKQLLLQRFNDAIMRLCLFVIGDSNKQ